MKIAPKRSSSMVARMPGTENYSSGVVIIPEE